EKVIEGNEDPEQVMESIYAKSRDNARTPFQWSDKPQAGFTTGKPWIKVNQNYNEINANQAIEDPNSFFHYYRKLIQLRKQYPIIIYGKYQLLRPEHEQVIAYLRTYKGQKLLVITNFSKENIPFTFPEDIPFYANELLISNYKIDGDNFQTFTLKPYEARVYLGI